LSAMSDLDEKWVTKISDGHRDNVEFLLRKQRCGQADSQDQPTGRFHPGPGQCGNFHVQGVIKMLWDNPEYFGTNEDTSSELR
jgi:hypothetical protein